MRGVARATLVDDPEVDRFDVIELEVIDLSDPLRARSASDPRNDLRSFEERYATLAFGLGTVPRRQHPDDPLWQRPTGLLLAVSGVLAFLLLLSAAH